MHAYENAPGLNEISVFLIETCPGTSSENAGSAEPCHGCPNQQICSSNSTQGQVDPDIPLIQKNLSFVKNIILVLSGKGGVGKSTFSTLLATILAQSNDELQVGLLDLDICGPTIPIMTGTSGESLHASGLGLEPIRVLDNLSVISVSYMLPSDELAIVWKGPKKNGLIKQFLKDVNWAASNEEQLDYLIVDTPPGTSDEHISIAKLLNTPAKSYSLSAVVVSTSQELSISDVKKEISFCKKVSIPILGIIENMSSFACPSCHKHSNIFQNLPNSGCSALCTEMQVPFLGSVPIDPEIGKFCDEGKVDEFRSVGTYPILQNITENIISQLSKIKPN